MCFRDLLNTFSAQPYAKIMPYSPSPFAASLKSGCLGVISILLYSSVFWTQEVQLSQRSIGNENHYAISNPSQLEGDVIIAGAYEFPTSTTNARLKRLKANGDITWDIYMKADGMPNRAMHLDRS